MHLASEMEEKNMSMSIRMRATINALTVVADNLRILHDAPEIMKETSDAVKAAKTISTAAKKVENFAKKYDIDLDRMKSVYNDVLNPDYFIMASFAWPNLGMQVYNKVKVNDANADSEVEP